MCWSFIISMKKSDTVVKFWKYRIIRDTLKCIPIDDKIVVNTISPNSYGISVGDSEMDKALQMSDYLILDGVYFGILPLLMKGERIKRITGWDSFQFFSKRMEENNGRVFFLGSDLITLNKIKNRYQKEFPHVEVSYYSPPFKPSFTKEDNSLMIKHINDFAPNVLFVGMTAPKQEKWAINNKAKLNVNVISTIGNVFDWYAGNSKRPSVFWQRIGMEWFVRIFLRPEVFQRNIKNQMLFFWHLLLIIIRIKKI